MCDAKGSGWVDGVRGESTTFGQRAFSGAFGNLTFIETKCVNQRKLFFDKSDVEYESELSERVAAKGAIKFNGFSNGDGRKSAKLDQAETAEVHTSHPTTESMDSIAKAFSMSSSLRMIQQSYADSDSPSPTASPSISRKRKKVNGDTTCVSESSSRSSSVSSVSSSKSSSHEGKQNDVLPSVAPHATTPPTSPIPEAASIADRPIVAPSKSQNRSPSSSRLSKALNLDSITTAKAPSPTTKSGIVSAGISSKGTNGNGVVMAMNSTCLAVSRGQFDAGDQRPSTSKAFLDGDLSPSPSVNGVVIGPHGDGPFSSVPQRNGSSVTRLPNGAIKVTRKRVLSDRGEAAAKYPVVDRRSLLTTWDDCSFLRNSGRNVGVGLLNHSNDCFLNAVLQAMVHTAPLARYVAEQHSSVRCNTLNCFVCAMGSHVRRAISSSTPFKAQWIQPFLRKIFPSHTQGLQEDAHELFTLILDALDPSPTTEPGHRGTPSSTNLKEVTISTPVEQIFGGTLRNQIQCLVCSEKFINYERIRELNLGMRMRKREGPIRMFDLLSDYFGIETITFECNNCRSKTQAQRSSRVLRAPNVLLVQLKRFNAFGSKVKLPVHIENSVRLDRFMFNSEEKNLYQLCAVIEHMGTGLDHGHYVAYVRGFDGRTWHQLDDESSSKVAEEFVCARQAYLMVYTLKESEQERVPFAKANEGTQNRFANKNQFRHSKSAATVLTASQMWGPHTAGALGRAGAS